MKIDQCPYCGADTEEKELCPVCGRQLAASGITDPFAAAMTQERRSREQQAAMREKYRPEPEKTAGTPPPEPETLPEPHSSAAAPAEAAQPRKHTHLLYAVLFFGILLLLCSGLFLLNRHMLKKNNSYAFYSKDYDLWFYSEKAQNTICLAENSIPYATNNVRDFLDWIYKRITWYDAKNKRIWYPVKLDAGHDDCTLAYRSLTDPNTEVLAADISLTHCIGPQRFTFLVYSQFDSEQYTCMAPPCIFTENAVYYISSTGQFCVLKNGTETVLSECVYRFWQADEHNILFLSPEENNYTGEIYSTFGSRQTYEEPPVPCALFRIHNDAAPQMAAEHITSWNWPEGDSPCMFCFATNETDGTQECTCFKQYHAKTGRTQTLVKQDNEPDCRFFVLRCYPDGSCYVGCKNAKKRNLFIMPYSSQYVPDAGTCASNGLWFYDATTRIAALASENDSSIQWILSLIDSFNHTCCRAKPYYIVEGKKLYYKDQVVQQLTNTDEANTSYSFSPDGTYLMRGIINLDDQSEAVSFSSVIGTIQYGIGKLNGTEEVSFSDPSVPLELDIRNPSAFFWHTDPKTHEEKCICITDAGLTAGNSILQEPVQQLCCDYPEFGQFYAVSEYGADYTHGGKLSRLQDGAWVPVANSVNTYIPVEPDALYLINGAPVPELILKRGEQEFSIDTVTAVLHAAAPGSP